MDLDGLLVLEEALGVVRRGRHEAVAESDAELTEGPRERQRPAAMHPENDDTLTAHAAPAA